MFVIFERDMSRFEGDLLECKYAVFLDEPWLFTNCFVEFLFETLAQNYSMANILFLRIQVSQKKAESCIRSIG